MPNFVSAQYDASPAANTSEGNAQFQRFLQRTFNSRADAILDAMMRQNQAQVIPLPPPVDPYRITGTTYYCDPVVAPGGNGSFATPFKYPESAEAVMVAGDGLLVKVGTVAELFNPLGFLSVVNGTAANPIVFGVYDVQGGIPFRVSGIPGAATLDCRNVTVCAATFSGRSYICFEGFRCIRNTNALFGMVDLGGNSANCQILNCVIQSPLGVGIRNNSTGANNVIEYNQVYAAGNVGIQGLLAATDTTSVYSRNLVSGASAGIWVFDSTNAFSFSGSIYGNIIENTTNAIGSIAVGCAGGAFRIFQNRATRGFSGISWNGQGAASGNFTGAIIQNNYCANVQFGVACNRTRGRVLIQFNNIRDCGSIDGVNPIDAARYGRCIEIFDAISSATTGSTDIIIEYNICMGAICWNAIPAGAGSEGVGVGLDNNARNCVVRYNYIANNEGNGIQLNSNLSNLIHNNLLVNNACVAGNRIDPNTPYYNKSEILLINTYSCRVFNNTCVSFGKLNQLYGYTEAAQFPNFNTEVKNNIFIGPKEVGLLMSAGTAPSVEQYNRVIGSPIVSASAGNRTVAIANGVGTARGIPEDVNMNSIFYEPLAGNSCDGTGVAVLAGTYGFLSRAPTADTFIGASAPVMEQL